MENLTDIGEPLRGGLIDNLSRFAGESPEATQRAFTGALPTSMYAIADYGSSEAGAGQLLDGFASNKLPAVDVDGLGRSLNDPEAAQRLAGAGGGFLDGLFGNKLGGLVGALSSHTGANSVATGKILAMATPLALGLISRHARASNLDARGLSGFLSQQKTQIAQMLPAGVGKLLGAQSLADQPYAAPEATGRVDLGRRAHGPHRAERTLQARPWWPLALAGLAALIGTFALLGRDRLRTGTERTTPEVTAPRTGPTAEVPLREGLNAYFNGTDETPRRFVLTGSGTEKADLVAALVAHPEATARIDGVVSSDSASGAALTRATELKEELVSMGVSDERIELGTRVGDGVDRLEIVIAR